MRQGVPHLPASQGHSATGWARGRQEPPGPGSAPDRGGDVGRCKRRVLLPARAGKPCGCVRRGAGCTVRALELDDAERAHLHDLARAASSKLATKKRAHQDSVRKSLQTTLDAITAAPAIVNNGRGDLIAANSLARALYSEMYVQSQRRPVNHARFVFLDPRSTTFYSDWTKVADDSVAVLRTAAGRDPYDRTLSDLVGELPPKARSSVPAGPLTTFVSTTPVRKRVRHPLSLGITLDVRGLRHLG